jgi:hypothetical protein
MANRIHRLLKVIVLNANGTWRQCYKLSKQLHGLHKDAAVFRNTPITSENDFIQNYHFYWPDRHTATKDGTAVAVGKCIPHNRISVPNLVSAETTVFCIPIGNCELQ